MIPTYNDARSALKEISTLKKGLVLVIGSDKAQNKANMQLIREMFDYTSMYGATTVEVGAEHNPNNSYSVRYEDLVSIEDMDTLTDGDYWTRIADMTELHIFRELTHRNIIFENIDDYLCDIAIDYSNSIFTVAISLDVNTLEEAIQHLSSITFLDSTHFNIKAVILSNKGEQ